MDPEISAEGCAQLSGQQPLPSVPSTTPASLQNIVGLRITASRPAADSTIGGGTVLPKRISTYRRVVLRSWWSRGETLETTSLADEKRLL